MARQSARAGALLPPPGFAPEGLCAALGAGAVSGGHGCRTSHPARPPSRRRGPPNLLCGAGGGAPGPGGGPRGLLLFLLLLAALPHALRGFRVDRAWTTKHWCESVLEPQWPTAYAKVPGSTSVELKGRTMSSAQDMGHVCRSLGALSKCHRCRDIQCQRAGAPCNFQVQGVDWAQLPANVPTASDGPWAVGGAHRNDFGRASHACVMLSGGGCTLPNASAAFNYTACAVRCWGYGSPAPTFTPTRPGWTVSRTLGNAQVGAALGRPAAPSLCCAGAGGEGCGVTVTSLAQSELA